MEFKIKAAERIAKSVLDDVFIEFENLRKAYFETDEFKNLVADKIKEIEELEDKANDMYDAVGTLPEASTMSLNGHYFRLNKETDLFEYSNGDIKLNAESMVKTKLHMADYSCSLTRKRHYIENRVLAIVTTFANNIDFFSARKAVLNQINLEEILHNKNIC